MPEAPPAAAPPAISELRSLRRVNIEFLLWLQYPRVLLPLENQFCGQQGGGLILGYLRAVHNVFNELRPERQRQILAVNVAGRLAVDNQQVIPTWRTGNVDTLPQFDIPLGSQNEGPFVAKRPQGIWSEP